MGKLSDNHFLVGKQKTNGGIFFFYNDLEKGTWRKTPKTNVLFGNFWDDPEILEVFVKPYSLIRVKNSGGKGVLP